MTLLNELAVTHDHIVDRVFPRETLLVSAGSDVTPWYGEVTSDDQFGYSVELHQLDERMLRRILAALETP